MKKKNPFSGNPAITIMRWRSVHPKNLSCRSDAYYARLATRLSGRIRMLMSFHKDFDEDDCAHLAIESAAYLEDKVSGLNCWNTFISLYREKFGTPFPFYDIEGEEMYDDEPNLPDVRFIVWKALDWKDEDSFLDPRSETVGMLAEAIFSELADAYEVAPENDVLRSWIFDVAKYDSPIFFREACQWICSNSYLFRCVNMEDCFNVIHQFFQRFYGKSLSEDAMVHAIGSYFSMNLTCGPLNLHPWEWLAGMFSLSEDEECRRFASTLRDADSVTLSPYEVVGIGEESLDVRGLSGDVFTVSFKMLKKETIGSLSLNGRVIMPMFRYQGMWHLNGILSFTHVADPFSKEIARYAENKERQRDARELMLKKNGGIPIGVAADFDEIKRHFGLENVPDNSSDSTLYRAKKSQDILYFINDNGQLAMLDDGAKVVAIEGNRFYDREYAAENGSQLIIGDAISREMRAYIVEHGLLPDAQLVDYESDAEFKLDEEEREWFQNNMAFLNVVCHTDNVGFGLH